MRITIACKNHESSINYCLLTLRVPRWAYELPNEAPYTANSFSCLNAKWALQNTNIISIARSRLRLSPTSPSCVVVEREESDHAIGLRSIYFIQDFSVIRQERGRTRRAYDEAQQIGRIYFHAWRNPDRSERMPSWSLKSERRADRFWTSTLIIESRTLKLTGSRGHIGGMKVI